MERNKKAAASQYERRENNKFISQSSRGCLHTKSSNHLSDSPQNIIEKKMFRRRDSRLPDSVNHLTYIRKKELSNPPPSRSFFLNISSFLQRYSHRLALEDQTPINKPVSGAAEKNSPPRYFNLKPHYE